MRKATAIFFFISVLVLASTHFTPRVNTQDCFVQIVSVDLNKSSFFIGERLQANITYNLYYDATDPFGLGTIVITIDAFGGGNPIYVKEFTEVGINVEKSVTVDILPQDWTPNTDGQIGSIQVSGWVQDSHNSMTDQVTQEILIQRSEPELYVEPTPPNLVFHDILNVTAHVTNPHNHTIPLANHEVSISVSNISQMVQTWTLNTSVDGSFTKLIDTTTLGSGSFSYNVTSLQNDDYLKTSYLTQFNITKASLLLNVELNATAYQAYFPLMNNYTAIVTAEVNCHQEIHDMTEATVSWSLNDERGELAHLSGNLFRGEIRTPATPGVYYITVNATVANHKASNVTIPLFVEPRKPIFALSTNCSHAAYGDIINISLTVTDYGCSKPVGGKPVYIYIDDNSGWKIIAQLLLDDNGFTSFCWQAVDDGYEAFTFMAFFEGGPEYSIYNQTITVDNTKNIRFHIADNVIENICGTQSEYLVQITTLDGVPLPDLTLNLVDLETDSIWCTLETNASGFATLSWYTPIGYDLGIHQFSLVCQDSVEILAVVSITMVVYSTTLLQVIN
jgi:hypothetical protein